MTKLNAKLKLEYNFYMTLGLIIFIFYQSVTNTYFLCRSKWS